jgi:flagellar biosynthesis protein
MTARRSLKAKRRRGFPSHTQQDGQSAPQFPAAVRRSAFSGIVAARPPAGFSCLLTIFTHHGPSGHDRREAQLAKRGKKERRSGAAGDDVAVALAYKPGSDEAPRVVAKGEKELARRIVDIARENGIAIERDANLAQLLSAVDLDREIPAEAFAAVAEILGYLYRVNGRVGELTQAVKDEEK